MITTGAITLTDKCHAVHEDGYNYDYQSTITVEYVIDTDKQVMSYIVKTDRHRVYGNPLKILKEIKDAPYSFQELHLAATNGFFRDFYPGLPELEVQLVEGRVYTEVENGNRYTSIE